jgi:hypothetical protein
MVMKSFDDRQKGFEAEFKREQELSFRITARRNKLFGLWAAERLGLQAGEEAETYAKSVVAADFEVPGDSDVIEKVRADLAAKGIDMTEADIRSELARAATKAREPLAER